MKLIKNKKLIQLIQPDVIKILDIIPNTRIIGGWIRDCLWQNLGRVENLNNGDKILNNIDKNDLDFATECTPTEIIQIAKKNNIKTFDIGMEFGTVGLLINGKIYEITTLRKDLNCFGRHAIVEFGKNWAEDAARRDFTMNAISMDKNGNIYDYFNGMEDIKMKKVAFIGNAESRIQEDYLRILRYFRFIFKLNNFNNENFKDNEIYDVLCKNSIGLKNISGERIREEIFKIINSLYSKNDFKKFFFILKKTNCAKYIGLNCSLNFDKFNLNDKDDLCNKNYSKDCECNKNYNIYSNDIENNKKYDENKNIFVSYNIKEKYLQEFLQNNEIFIRLIYLINLFSKDFFYDNVNYDIDEKIYECFCKNSNKNNKNNAKIKKIEKITKYITQNIVKRWKLSNKNAEILLDISTCFVPNLENENCNMKYEKYIFILYSLLVRGYINFKKFDNLYENSRFLIKEQFPLNGYDMMNLGFNGKKIGESLNFAKKLWIKSKGCANKEELIKNLKDNFI